MNRIFFKKGLFPPMKKCFILYLSIQIEAEICFDSPSLPGTMMRMARFTRIRIAAYQ